MDDSKHSDKSLQKLRIVVVASFLMIAARIVTDFIYSGNDTQFTDGFFSIYVYYIFNAVLCLLFLYLMWRPERLELVAYAAFPYALVVLLDRRTTPLSVELFAVGMVALYCRGLLRKHPVRKAIISAVAFLIPMFMRLRFGLDEFLAWLPDTIVQLLTFAIIFTLLNTSHTLRKKAKPSPEILNLNDYPELNERDREWIRLALDNTKYDTIARQYDVTSGTVKNRMRQIYKILGVSDRLSLIVAFGKCEVLG